MAEDVLPELLEKIFSEYKKLIKESKFITKLSDELSKGIAKDIFGTYENYVLPVQSLSNKDDLINAFEWMKTNEDEIRKHLNEFIPGYKEKALQGKIEIDKLLEE